jgi:hypothetical protein
VPITELPARHNMQGSPPLGHAYGRRTEAWREQHALTLIKCLTTDLKCQ